MNDSDIFREEESAPDRLEPDKQMTRRQDTELLYAALDKLSHEKRQLLALRRIQNLEYVEIAKLLGCEVKPLKVRVHRAFQELQQVFHQMTKERTLNEPAP